MTEDERAEVVYVAVMFVTAFIGLLYVAFRDL